MQWSTKSMFPALGLMAAACLSACGESAAPSASASAVDTAYAALVSDVAGCAKEVKSCVDAAADDSAIDDCRADFATCRQGAGKKHVDALADAASGCRDTHKECVRTAESGEAGGCADDLRVCLRAARPQQPDDEDAGPGAGKNDAPKAARADCLDELHPCVKADGPANVCAEQVRACLVDSVPSPAAVVPEEDEDEDGTEDHEPADTADAGIRGKRPTTSGRACVDTLRTCVDAGNAPRDCAKQLKQCRADAK